MAFLATLEPQVARKRNQKRHLDDRNIIADSCHSIFMFGQVFLYILASISEGLQALGGNLNYFTGAGDKLKLL